VGFEERFGPFFFLSIQFGRAATARLISQAILAKRPKAVKPRRYRIAMDLVDPGHLIDT